MIVMARRRALAAFALLLALVGNAGARAHRDGSSGRDGHDPGQNLPRLRCRAAGLGYCSTLWRRK